MVDIRHLRKQLLRTGNNTITGKINRIVSEILERHGPLINIYLANGTSTSSDDIGSQTVLRDWQAILYTNLSSLFKDVSTPTDVHGVRYGELERLMLGLIFAHAVYDYSDWGKGFIETCSDSPIKEEFVRVIQSMLPAKMSGKTESGENHIQSNTSETNHVRPLFDIEGHFILSDITKSQAVINRLKMHDSSMQDASDSFQLDHDLAYQYLMSLDNEIIREIIGVNIPDRILEYSKLVSCPLHLGHASQAECHWSKIHECQLAHADVSDKENLLNRAFLVQYFDIAGARAHKTGKSFSKTLFLLATANYTSI